ncbi:hypothetical protein G647_06323 [Cladophialophora carrionii CBS 160.54]|uniref:Uncharacterized protein n=1 Tax=Cladophialophora carrionii CBS 160.54 TaxID=1279043 RepID=V9D5U8_9EURO|nr:uncharacterized protein G647_06323 [Cladophialophora carrionii CBS 160.54]ETI22250.1 hypothetical protein G647_06323 [Cladophialophora carrionii CBS 160.54]
MQDCQEIIMIRVLPPDPAYPSTIHQCAIFSIEPFRRQSERYTNGGGSGSVTFLCSRSPNCVSSSTYKFWILVLTTTNQS